MGRIPVLKPQEVCKILEKHGFQQVRQKGSHIQYRHQDGRGTTVPMHKGRDISPFLVRKIADDVRMNIEQFLSVR
jgi:predicted RNA binding protein YcfA (HicA-like mRNA interferase family)